MNNENINICKILSSHCGLWNDCFWIVTRCSMVNVHTLFTDAWCLRHQGIEGWLHCPTTQKKASSFTLVSTCSSSYTAHSHAENWFNTRTKCTQLFPCVKLILNRKAVRIIMLYSETKYWEGRYLNCFVSLLIVVFYFDGSTKVTSKKISEPGSWHAFLESRHSNDVRERVCYQTEWNTELTKADVAEILGITIIDCFQRHLYLLQWRHVYESNLFIIT